MKNILLNFFWFLVPVLSNPGSAPTEELIESNLNRLNDEQWFFEYYTKHKHFFVIDEQVRTVVGLVKIDLIVQDERWRKEFLRLLTDLIHKE